MVEFTGERVIPGQVEPDLWNEHLSRYLFAAQLALGKRIADLGCGTGYGAAELARTAKSVVGIDLSADAVGWAKENFSTIENLRFEQGPCESLPLPSGSVDLAVAFEVIEHLANPEALLDEARRILAPDGHLVVSTPNIEYYVRSRKTAGPNPFHHREYSLREFTDMLERYFPGVSIFTQNHVPVIAFQRTTADEALSPVVRNGGPQDSPETAHFFVAVCSVSRTVDLPAFLYVPSTANILAERELHIDRLESELRQKQEWLDRSTAELGVLLDQHRKLKGELETANTWAKSLDEELAEKVAHVKALKDDLSATQAALNDKVAEHGRAIELLHVAEAEVEARTHWALSLEAEKNALLERMRLAADSRWMRVGRKIHLGPDLRQ